MGYENCTGSIEGKSTIKHISCHSLGVAVALELQKNHPERKFTTNTYAAPVMSITKSEDGSSRYRNYGGPFSILDWGADHGIKRNCINNVVNFSPLSVPLALGKGMLDAHYFTNFTKNKSPAILHCDRLLVCGTPPWRLWERATSLNFFV
jgi:hypothetical protein